MYCIGERDPVKRFSYAGFFYQSRLPCGSDPWIEDFLFAIGFNFAKIFEYQILTFVVSGVID
jgi:hypothetical protein